MPTGLGAEEIIVADAATGPKATVDVVHTAAAR
jgi:hypothetical protein